MSIKLLPNTTICLCVIDGQVTHDYYLPHPINTLPILHPTLVTNITEGPVTFSLSLPHPTDYGRTILISYVADRLTNSELYMLQTDRLTVSVLYF